MKIPLCASPASRSMVSRSLLSARGSQLSTHQSLTVPSMEALIAPRARTLASLSPAITADGKEQTADGSTTARRRRPIYVAATRQHVGKTSVSLAIMSGLQKRFNRVGFIKPVGQQFLTVEETAQTADGAVECLVDIDKDAVLIKNCFHLDHLTYSDCSPVVIKKGYTKDYVNGIKTLDEQKRAILSAVARQQDPTLPSGSEVILCEGTGHCAVGSIVDASNAAVASWIGARMVLVANGGLGKTFDELELNRSLCEMHGVEVAGVIINKVKEDKFDETKYYLTKTFKDKWGDDIPLLGCVPDRPFLGCAALADLERLLDASLVSQKEHRLRHYRSQDVTLVSTSLEVFLKDLHKATGRRIYVCHASRNDIMLGFLMECVQRAYGVPRASGSKAENCPYDNDGPWESAMVVTGCDEYPISTQVLEIVTSLPNAPPVMLTKLPTDAVMKAIYSYTPKLNSDDEQRVAKTANHYEPHIDFDALLERVGYVDDESRTASA